MRVNKRQIERAKNQVAKTVKEHIDQGHMSPEINNLVPMIIVGQISPRRWTVSFNYQPKDTQDGDTAIMPHPENFIGIVKVYRVENVLKS